MSDDLGCDVVTVTVPEPFNVHAAETGGLVASITVPDQPSVQATQPPATVIAVIETGAPGPPGPSGVSGMTGITVDQGEPYKVILFSTGQVKAIPMWAEAPTVPTGLGRTIRINSVKLTWTPVSGASQYIVWRDGSQVAVANSASFLDTHVVVGSTYTYSLQAADGFGQRSVMSSSVSAFIDPALNAPPTIDIRSWPTSVALGNRCIIRVNATDIDAQTLALALNVNVGSLIPYADPSVWILEPV